MILPVVPNIKSNIDTGNWYCLKKLETFSPCSVSVCMAVIVSKSMSSMGVNYSLYYWSLHNSLYYPVSTDLSLPPPPPHIHFTFLGVPHTGAVSSYAVCMLWSWNHRHTSSSWQSHCNGFTYRYSVEHFGNALNIFISRFLRSLLSRSSHSRALTFVNVSSDT
jgi:hypothetical protein